MDKIMSQIGKTMALIGAFGVCYIMIATVADVVSRQFTGRSIPGTIETAEVVLVVSVFLSLGYAQKTSQHFAMNLVTDRIPVRLSLVLQACGLVVGIVTLLLLSWALWGRAIETTIVGEYRFGAIPIPIWPARIAAAFGTTYFAAEVVVTLVKLLNGTSNVRSEEVAIGTRSEREIETEEKFR